MTVGGVRTMYVFGLKKVRKGSSRPKRPPTYGPETLRHLKQLWALAGGLCGKRLAPFIRETLPVLERFEEITLSVEVRRKLVAISPATIDRLLAPERKKYQLKGRSTTRPGSLLKNQIPIRTFADWDEKRPGFVEVDLVAHEGGLPGPEVIHSLTMTDVATGWTEVRPLKTKARRWVLEALADITPGLPFPLRGIDCDNGSEFINVELAAYCAQHRLTFTRSRPYRKKDSCFVEQKNYSIVRQTVGYLRLQSQEQLECLRNLYGPVGLFTNHFQPSVKL
ncbi:MAG: transposase family protein, partial [Proteobacteria bacterium]|nr:transposase family protein [Pseudomonadota bacterium]